MVSAHTEPPSPLAELSQGLSDPQESPRQSSALEDYEDRRPPRRAFRRKRRGPNFVVIAIVIAGCLALLVALVIGGLATYHHFARSGPISNRERLVGVWETQAEDRLFTFEFRAGGRFRLEERMLDAGTRRENNGTWEVLSENGNDVKIRTITSDGHDTFTHDWEVTFLDDDTLTRPDLPGHTYYRRR